MALEPGGEAGHYCGHGTRLIGKRVIFLGVTMAWLKIGDMPQTNKVPASGMQVSGPTVQLPAMSGAAKITPASSEVYASVMRLRQPESPVSSGPAGESNLPFIAQLKARTPVKQPIGERVLDELSLTVRAIKAEPDLMKRVAGYMRLHNSVDWASHMDPKTKLEWAIHSAGVPTRLGQAIAADRGVLPERFDLARNVPLFGGVVKTDEHLATLVGRLTQIKKSGYSGYWGAHGLDQLAAKVTMGKDGPQQIKTAKMQGYQFLEDGPDKGVWQLRLKGDHRLAATVKSDELPSVDYAVVITGNALQKLYEDHLKTRAVKIDWSGGD